MQQIVKDGAAVLPPRCVESVDAAKAELADEPFKLELVDVKSDVDTDEVMEVGGGELTDLRQPRPAHRRAGLGRPVPRPAPADHQAHPGVQADPRRPPRTGAATRRTRSCSASTAPRGSRRRRSTRYLELLEEAERRDHRKLGVELDLFSFPDEIGSGLPVFHPKGGIIRREMEDYSRQRHERGRLRVRQHPAHHQGHLFDTSGHLDWYADGMFPPMHLDAESTRTARCASPARTTTSSR